jgi:hypothetical protein
MVQMKKIYASLRDGMSAPGDWFDALQPAANTAAAEAGKSKTETLKSKLGAGKKQAEPARDQQDDDLRSLERQAAAEQQTVDPETGEVQRDEWLEGYEAAEVQR